MNDTKSSDYIEIILDVLDLRNRVEITHFDDIYTKGGGDANGCILNKLLYKASDLLPIYVSREAIKKFKELNISNYKEIIIHEVFNRSMKNVKAHQFNYNLFRNPKTKEFHLDHNAPMAYICKKLTKLNYKKGKEYLRKKVTNILKNECGIDCITKNENALRNHGVNANNKNRKERIQISKSKMLKIQ